MVDDFDNGGKLASVGVVAVDDNDSADLNEAPVGSLNDCVAHFDGDLISSGQSQILESRASGVQGQLLLQKLAFIPIIDDIVPVVRWVFAGVFSP